MIRSHDLDINSTVKVTVQRRLLVGRDAHLDQSEVYLYNQQGLKIFNLHGHNYNAHSVISMSEYRQSTSKNILKSASHLLN